MLDRFWIEARAIAQLSHPNIVTIYRTGEVNQVPYLASEYIEGKSLDSLPLPSICRSWCGSRSASPGPSRRPPSRHSASRHWPANIMMTNSGEVKLLILVWRSFWMPCLRSRFCCATSATRGAPGHGKRSVRSRSERWPWRRPRFLRPQHRRLGAVQTMRGGPGLEISNSASALRSMASGSGAESVHRQPPMSTAWERCCMSWRVASHRSITTTSWACVTWPDR